LSIVAILDSRISSIHPRLVMPNQPWSHVVGVVKVAVIGSVSLSCGYQ